MLHRCCRALYIGSYADSACAMCVAALQVSSLLSYAAAAQRLGLVRLAQSVADACARPEVWRQLQQNKQVRSAMDIVYWTACQASMMLACRMGDR
jgi:hypothetical protein